MNTASTTWIWRRAAFAWVIVILLTLGIYAQGSPNVTYKSVKLDGLNIFYREAGDPQKPTILLLHGFPASSHLFRNLIPKLSDKFHVVAPDYPGFGYSSAPATSEFDYTFDNLAIVVERFSKAIGLGKFAI